MKEIGKMTGKLSGKKVLHAPFGRTINLATAFMMEAVAKLTGWIRLLRSALQKNTAIAMPASIIVKQ